MSQDDRLRSAARDASRSGADADRARLLVMRVRGGQLRPERLELAARLGHPLACLALGRAPFACGDDPRALVVRLEHDAQALARVALAAARLALGRRAPFPDLEDDLPHVHARLTEWVRSDGRSAAPAVPRRRVVTVKHAHGTPADYCACHLDDANLAIHLARVAHVASGELRDVVRAVVNGSRRWAAGDVAVLAQARGDWIEWWAEVGPAADRAVAAAVRREVGPWALGEPDPLTALVA